MKHSHILGGGMAAISLLLAACSTTPDPISEAEAAPMARSQTEDPSATGYALQQRYQTDAERQAIARLAEERLIYFEFDQSTPKANGEALLAQHAQYLVAHPDVRVRLEGHADERGSREYNMALGERRALNIRRALQLRGVSPTQLDLVSYGEEQPVVASSDSEESHAENRRVELRYLSGEVAAASGQQTASSASASRRSASTATASGL